MTLRKTEEQKAAASVQQKRHWRRCSAWAETVDLTKEEINSHWSCCVSPNTNGGVDGVKKALADHFLRNAKHSNDMAEWRDRQESERRNRVVTPRRTKAPEPIPELEQRIKIMIWAVKKTGGVANARDALDRAIRSLKD
jgi:hypothetical protein